MNVPDPAVQQARSASVAGSEFSKVSRPAVRSAEHWRQEAPATARSCAAVVAVTLTFVLEFIATVSIIFGVSFGLVQLCKYRVERVHTSLQELLRYFQTPEGSRAFLLVYSFPDKISRAQIEERLGAEFSTVHSLLATWESHGILVFRNEADLDLVDEFFSGPIVHSFYSKSGGLALRYQGTAANRAPDLALLRTHSAAPASAAIRSCRGQPVRKAWA